MQPERLSERASKIAEEAKSLLEIINKFGAGSERMVLDAIRRSAMNDMEQTFQKVMKEVEKEEEHIKLYTMLNSNEEVWITARACTYGKHEYIINAEKINRKTAFYKVAEMRAKIAFYIRVEIFKNLIKELNASILEGKLDENIHLPGEQIIYNKIYEASDSLIKDISQL